MAVSTTTLALLYTGNGSTSTAYQITFPFLDASHIYAAVSSDGEEDPVLLEPADYTVTRLADGSGGSLVTAEAVTSPATIRIFRDMPLTQPVVLQAAGPLPSRTIEQAFDRLMMQVQQLNRKINGLHDLEGDDYIEVPGAGATQVLGVETWEDSTERGAKVPKRAGQLGVEKATQSLWIAQSTTVGDWKIFRPRSSERLVIGLVADGGEPSAYQTLANTLLTNWECDAVLFAGDNNYSGAAGYTADWAAFSTWITAQKAYPALGNHDIDEAGWEARHTAKFPYLPGNGRYYNKVLGDDLVELFVLHSGLDSDYVLQEEDGNTVGSTQHDWFVAALAASTARWKIAMFHHPPTTLESSAETISEDMQWPELAQMDLICCGHTHLLEIIKWSDTMLLNVSALARDDGDAAAVLQGGGPADVALWADNDRHGMGRIVASQDKLSIEVWALNVAYTGTRLLHSRDARDLSVRPLEVETFSPWAFNDTIEADETRYVQTIPVSLALVSAMIALVDVDVAADVTWTLFGGAVELAGGVIPSGQVMHSVDCFVPESVIPRGTIMTLQLEHAGTISGAGLSLTFQRFS